MYACCDAYIYAVIKRRLYIYMIDALNIYIYIYMYIIYIYMYIIYIYIYDGTLTYERQREGVNERIFINCC